MTKSGVHRKIAIVLALAAAWLACSLASCAYAQDKPAVFESHILKTLPTATTLNVNTGTTAAASLNVPCSAGVAPTSPNDGDVWCTSAGLYIRVGSSTIGPFAASTPTAPGGSSGQVEYNNSGAFGGFTVNGDATLNTGTGALTLAASGVSAATYGDATHVAQVTVDAKGRVTAASSVSITAGGGSPGGSSGQLQYNNAGVFGGFTLGGDCTFSEPTVTCTTLNGVSPGYYFNGTSAANLTGTAPNAILPVPTLSALGGVESLTCSTHNWLDAISTAGVPACAQPAFSDLSGNIATSQMNSGTGASSSTYWRGDNTWATPTGVSGANPSATAGPSAVNGSATTYMRSDGAPAVQKGSASQFGIVEADGTTIGVSGGILSVIGGGGGPGATTFYNDPSVLVITKPAASSFTVNTGSGMTASATNMASRGVNFQSSSGTGPSVSMELSALSSSAFTVTALVQPTYTMTNGTGTFFGITVKDSSGKYIGLGLKWTSGVTFAYFTFANLSTTASSVGNTTTIWPVGPIWLRVILTGGNFKFYASNDGENFTLIFTEGATAYLGSTLSTVGFIFENNGTGAALSWDIYSFTNTTP